MKKFGSFVVSIFAAGLFFINSASAESQALVSIFRDGVKFSESVYPYDGGLFISNYGSENMNPRADENSGYIIYRKDGIIEHSHRLRCGGFLGSLHKALFPKATPNSPHTVDSFEPSAYF